MNCLDSPNRKGMTLIELMIAVVILIPVLLIIIFVFINYLQIIELSRNTAQALLEVKEKIHDIELTDVSQVSPTFHQSVFQSSSLTGQGVCYVESLQADLLRVTVSFSWREKNGRIIGEDLDLDGVVDAGEDKNNNGRLDSPVTIVTLVYNM